MTRNPGTCRPAARLAALADAGSIDALPAAGESAHVARWGISPAADDGVVCARLAVGATRVLAMAQDARYLGGSVGANHGAALERLFRRALDERPDILVLLVDSGGVRLHEANAAELALARALRALFDVRRAGIATLPSSPVPRSAVLRCLRPRANTCAFCRARVSDYPVPA